ncbi:uncharacterized protein LOC116534657 [Sapajus apella]|uniref:Uncharacterized protein LOC116534657 n=1 Tax=Sapajus apella TaxID=9515 RepID=A0A6J3FZD1_SAPAP|nr:uncharacterized protein LOC116534657 [Sapajus apella]
MSSTCPIPTPPSNTSHFVEVFPDPCPQAFHLHVSLKLSQSKPRTQSVPAPLLECPMLGKAKLLSESSFAVYCKSRDAECVFQYNNPDFLPGHFQKELPRTAAWILVGAGSAGNRQPAGSKGATKEGSNYGPPPAPALLVFPAGSGNKGGPERDWRCVPGDRRLSLGVPRNSSPSRVREETALTTASRCRHCPQRPEVQPASAAKRALSRTSEARHLGGSLD